MKRYDLVDTLRGISIISMIAFHTCWLMNFFGLGVSTQTLYGPAFMAWERSICSSFILISGFSFSLGHRHLRSGILLSVTGLMITLITVLFLPGINIIFGILTFLGASTLILIPADKVFMKVLAKKDSPGTAAAALLIINLIFFLITYNMGRGYLGIDGLFTIELTPSLYRGYAATFVGFTEPGFVSADYFPFIPWVFLHICGYFLHKVVMAGGTCKKALSYGIPGLSFLGRHSLVIYLLHPVIIYAVLFLRVM